MKILFFLTMVVGSLTPCSLVHAASKTEQIEEIDRQISELEAKKRGYEARALRHENQAEWLQFDTEAVLETRRHLQLAEENREKARQVQQQIDALQEKKSQLGGK